MFEAMPSSKVQPTVISYCAAISACQGGQWQEALKLIEDMPQANFLPNVISYSAAIGTCEKDGQRQETLKLLEAMGAANCHELRCRHPYLLEVEAVAGSMERIEVV